MARHACTLLVAVLIGACTASGAPSRAPGVSWDVRDAPGPIADVVASGDLIVAGGSASTEGVPSRPAIWLSRDGRTWEPATVGGDGDIAALVVGEGLLLAAGSLPAESGTRAAAWTSPDGKAWALQGPDSFGPGTRCASTKAEDIAAGPDGFVAVGTEWGEGPCGQHAAAWVSADGRTWSRASVPTGGHAMHSVVHGAEGYVAVGSGTAAANEGTRAAFWFSADGRMWTQAPDAEGFHAAEAMALVNDAKGFIAVGTAITGRSSDAIVPVAWRSLDGRAWDRIATAGLAWQDVTGGTDEQLTTLALASELVSLPSGVLALGAGMTQRRDQGGGAQQTSPWRYLAWLSTSGDTWAGVPYDPALLVGTVNSYVVGPSAAVVIGSRLFLFGSRWPASSSGGNLRGLPTTWETDVTALGRGA